MLLIVLVFCVSVCVLIVLLLCLVYPILAVSLGCTFCIAPSVLCTQCCQCLWVVYSVLPRRSCVPNVASVSGLYILYCPSVLCTQCCQCLWVVHSVLPRRSCVPNVASVSGLYILYCPVGLVYPMLPVSLGCAFCIAPSVVCTQCCQCLWVVHSVLPRRSCVPNVASVSGLCIPHCPVGLVYPMLPVSLGCTFCIVPSVLCTQCCQCLWVVHSVLPRRSCVPNVASVSGLCIPHCPVGLVCPMLPVSLGCAFCIAPSVLCTQCCQCLWVVYSVLPRRSYVPNVASFFGLCILYCPVGFL